jgi:hypothetical protein
MRDDTPETLRTGMLGEPKADINTVTLYSNYAAVTSTPDELIFRFCQRSLEGEERPLEIARVIVSLSHAKRILMALGQTLKAYEELFGQIPLEKPLTAKGKEKLGSREESNDATDR